MGSRKLIHNKISYSIFALLLFISSIPVAFAERGNTSFLKSEYVSCGADGNALIGRIPVIFPNITSGIFNIIMFVIPVIMVIMGAIDLIKGISSQKEEEIKKGRQSFAKRLFAGAATLLIVLLVKTLVTFVDGRSKANGIIGCVDCFINSGSSCTKVSG